jgi:hypothetical protein|tara:strand:+ start:144 stop:587 length:444 start_codon:yes stop_codon:yes gene_type:complete
MEEVKKKSPFKKYLIIFTLGALLLLTGWLYYRYWFVYSEGTRVGILYKFSKKGTIFKTYEGEMLLPGIGNKGATTGNMTTNNFRFSVDDEELAKKLMNLQGMELELHYKNFNRALPWRGDNYDIEDGQYVVDKMIKIKNETPNGYGL